MFGCLFVCLLGRNRSTAYSCLPDSKHLLTHKRETLLDLDISLASRHLHVSSYIIDPSVSFFFCEGYYSLMLNVFPIFPILIEMLRLEQKI